MSITMNDPNNDVIFEKKVIPELMIPSFETSHTEDSSECITASIRPIISPDSTAGNTKSAMHSSTATGSSDYESSSPPSSRYGSNDINEAQSSPTNPSAPLTSPSKRSKPPMNKSTSPTQSSTSPPRGTENVLKKLSVTPAPISQRGRVVSLDRGGYAEYQVDDDEDDEMSSSSSTISSDGEGSYFSEHLPSPPRRTETTGSSNPKLLPPGGGGGGGGRSRNGQVSNMYPRQYSGMSHESDLSLSSSSCEDDDPQSRNVNLSNAYPITRTRSAPVKGAKLLPRHTRDQSLDLSYHSELNNNRDKLNVIGIAPEEQLSIPVPQNSKQFPSSSSLVSSSSEDVERMHVKPCKHRRQSSYRSVGSITSAGSAYLPEKPKKMDDSEYADVPSKLPELVSFSGGGSDASKHSKSSSSKKDYPIPLPRSYSDPQQVAILNDDQMNAWRSGGGISRCDSYVSSSHGNGSGTDISPDRPSRNFNENSSVSNGSKQSSQVSRSGSGIFIYSEDDTDESVIRERTSSLHASSNLNQGRPTNADARSRSFGRDLTNADEIEPIARNAQINPVPDRRAPKIYENHANNSMLSSNNQGSYRTSNDMYNDCETYNMMSRSNGYKVYWKRWLMLIYMSLLNLLSDWTCFSVAPIALLTKETFQIVNPEHLVTIFLFANTLATATEPILLARLGLRKTIVFGSFLLMCGNVIKSAGIPGFIGSGIEDETDAWRLFVGFFLVGLSQPLYQCTPSILSSSWFPEKERTLATGVALNSNQLGIGCSFVFGTLLVVTSDDISNYFGLLSILSTLVFIGCYFQFQDAPPTPPSETARVMKGNIMFPYFNNMHQSIPHYFRRFQEPIVPMGTNPYENSQISHRRGSSDSNNSRNSRNRTGSESITNGSRSSHRSKRSERIVERGSPKNAFKKSSSRSRPRRSSAENVTKSSNRRQRSNGSRSIKTDTSGRSRRRENARTLAPSPALGTESTASVAAAINELEREANNYGTVAPSPMMSGHVGYPRSRDGEPSYYGTPQRNEESGYQQPYLYTPHASGPGMSFNHRHIPNYYSQHNSVDHLDGIPPDTPFANLRHTNMPLSGSMTNSQHYPHAMPYDYADTPMQYFPPNIDPQYFYQHAPIPPGSYHNINHEPQYRPVQSLNPSYMYGNSNKWVPLREESDEGVEPVLTHAGSNLSIEIRDDQILRSISACFSRTGFIQTVIAFVVSGVVLNTISTYMDSLLSPSGAGRGAVGLIGGLFQALVMVSSMIIGKITDKRRAYYSVVIVLLLLGAFTLAECAINLEAERGSGLKWTLLILAVFVGPLQPVATELGVEV